MHVLGLHIDFDELENKATPYFKLVATLKSSVFLSFFLSHTPRLLLSHLTFAQLHYIASRCISLHRTCILYIILLLQICSAFPTSGGLYFWSAQLAGAKWSPFASWITGWYTSSSRINFPSFWHYQILQFIFYF